jgi:Cu(I)/Ag(I) efflux system membrane fusion protein
MKNLLLICLGGLITLAVVFGKTYLLPQGSTLSKQDADQKQESEQVLYWVAPMDANYRRDKPGKSPMGMDLVPVFADGKQESGVVKISAAVINNLGLKTAKVVKEKAELSFISSGQVHYAKESLVHLHARTSGWVEKLYVTDRGQWIKKGQPLYGIYSLEFIDAQEDYLRALNSQNKNLIKAAANRLHALRIDKKVIARLKRNKKVDQVTTFYAPQNGYIEALNINEGMYVKPENTLLTLADLNQVSVDIELEHGLIAWLSQYPGQINWALSSEYMPTQKWQGKLDYIYPMMSEQLRTIRVRLLVENHNQLLKPNMWLALNGSIKTDHKTLLIPKQALIRTEKQNRVVMADSAEGKEFSRFKSVAVTTGRSFDNSIEILAGIQAGDVVVTSAQFLIDSESNIDSDLLRMTSVEVKHATEHKEGMHDH